MFDLDMIDLQLNGYLSIEFGVEKDEEKIRQVCRKYLAEGAPKFLATVITSSKEQFESSLPILANIIEEEEFANRILGIHMEGPFISSEPGAVGAHTPEWTRLPDIDECKYFQELARGHIRLMTIAAELPKSDELCSYLRSTGVAVSLGHQNAKYEDLCRLYDAGAQAITHLGNGMPNMVPRHDNVLLNGLIHPELTAMLISDGHHLPLHLLEGIIKIKGVDKTIIVSDASPIAGMPPGNYNVLGNNTVLEENGYLHNPDKKCMVGSSATLKVCYDVCKDKLNLSESDLKKLFLENPLKLLS